MRRYLLCVCIRIALLLLAVSTGLWAVPAQASLIAYDGINYPVGISLTGQNGGFGWATAYINNQTDRAATIVSGSLPFGGLASSGNALLTSTAASGLTDNSRTLDTTVGADGTTAYIGFLMKPAEQPGAVGTSAYAGLRLGNLFVGKLTSGLYGIETAGGAGQSSSGVSPAQNTTVLLVARIRFQAGADQIDLFVNPTPGQPLPATPDATKTDLDIGMTNAFAIKSDHAVVMDEIRLGTTFDDVAPTTPVPSSAILLQSQTTNQIAIWLMGGSQVVGSIMVGPTPEAGWQVVGTGDFNQDGHTDLVFQNQTSGQVAIWFMNGPYYLDGALVAPTPSAGFKVCGVADMDGDGKPDLVFQNKTTGQIVLWFMNGTNLVGGLLLPQISAPSAQMVGVADFDFNGTADLLFQDDNSGQVIVWYMNRTVYSGGAILATVPQAGWKVRATADYNSDGRPDLVFQNVTTNQIALWYLKDFAYIGGSLVYTIPDADYHVVSPR